MIDCLCQDCGTGRIYRDEKGKYERGHLKNGEFDFSPLDINSLAVYDPTMHFIRMVT